jgi:hypothetical protein
MRHAPDTSLIRVGRDAMRVRGSVVPTVASPMPAGSMPIDRSVRHTRRGDVGMSHHDLTEDRRPLDADRTDELDRTPASSAGTAPENQEHGREAVGAGAGALGGAAVGMAVGGPPGAVIGGAIGAVGGAVAGEATEGDDEAGSGAGGLAGGLAGAAVGGALAGPPGAVVGGAVGAAGGAGVGDQSEEEVEESHPTTTAEVPRP